MRLGQPENGIVVNPLTVTIREAVVIREALECSLNALCENLPSYSHALMDAPLATRRDLEAQTADAAWQAWVVARAVADVGAVLDSAPTLTQPR